MSEPVTINANEMNGSVSIMLPMPTIIIQFPVGHGQYNGFNFACGHCVKCNRCHTKEETNDIKEEMNDIKEETIDITGETIDITEETIDITGETIDITGETIDITGETIDIKDETMDFAYGMDRYILHKDENLYAPVSSPVSNEQSEDAENNELYVLEDCVLEDYKSYFNDIYEIIAYLKEDIIED